MWDLIVSVPDHCLSFYYSCIKKKKEKNNNLYELRSLFSANPQSQNREMRNIN